MQIGRRHSRYGKPDPTAPSVIHVDFPGCQPAGRNTEKRPGIHAHLDRINHGAGNAAKQDDKQKRGSVSEIFSHLRRSQNKRQAHGNQRQYLLYLQAFPEQKPEQTSQEIIQRRMHILCRFRYDFSEARLEQIHAENFVRPYIVIKNQGQVQQCKKYYAAPD